MAGNDFINRSIFIKIIHPHFYWMICTRFQVKIFTNITQNKVQVSIIVKVTIR